MAIVRLRPPLCELADGSREVRVDGATVEEALRDLERTHPALDGRVLDDRGRVREHVAVFLGGERVRGGGRRGRPARDHRLDLRRLRRDRAARRDAEGAVRAPRTPRRRAGRGRSGVPRHDRRVRDARSPRPALLRERDLRTVRPSRPTSRPIRRLGTDRRPPDPRRRGRDRRADVGDRAGRGGRPALRGRRARRPVREPGRRDELGAEPRHVGPAHEEGVAAGGRRAGTRSHRGPAIPRGWRSGSRRPGVAQRGRRPDLVERQRRARSRYLPEESREDAIDLCVHNMYRAPLRPERLFMQFHGGVYRSDDAGGSWTSIADGLPSDFGFPMLIDPRDPDAAYVIPLNSDGDRVSAEGRLRVFETRDAGATWTARTSGPAPGRVPDHPAAGVRRRRRGAVRPVVRRDLRRRVRFCRRGASWRVVARDLAPVVSVRAA